jgi:hypothetical protein
MDLDYYDTLMLLVRYGPNCSGRFPMANRHDAWILLSSDQPTQ